MKRGLEYNANIRNWGLDAGNTVLSDSFLTHNLVLDIPLLNCLRHFLRFVGNGQKVKVFSRDEPSRQRHVPQPFHKTLPELAVEQDNGERSYLLGLHQRQYFGQFVERTQSARHYNKSGGIFHQHDFTDEEMTESE